MALVEQAGWAELAAVTTARLDQLPAGISTERAAALPLAGLTALRTLRLAGDLLGLRVLVTGASGGVGRMQVQLAAAAGAQVTAVARPAHEKELLALVASSVAADPAAARLVELRYFAGLTIEEAAEVLDISPATVKREWTTAKAFLKREMLRGGSR